MQKNAQKKDLEAGFHYIYVKYITKNGVHIYPKTAKSFRIKVKD